MKIKKKWIKVLLSVLGLAAAVAAVVLFLPKILNIIGYLVELFLPFLLGYLFSMAVNPLADMLQNKLKIPRGLSAVLVIVLIIGLLGGLLTFIVWKIIDEARTIYSQFPIIYQNAQNTMESVGSKLSVVYTNLPINVQESLTSLGAGISSRIAEIINNFPIVDNAGSFAKAVPSVFVAVIVFILSSYFMVSDNSTVSAAIKRLISPKLAERMSAVRLEFGKYLGGYFKAQGILMCIAFVIMFIGFSILDINFALLIALGIAIIDALPFFGSGLILIPWTIIAFINGNISLGLGLLIIYASVLLMRRFAEPKLVSSSAGMNPILTLISMYVGYKTLSIGGLILGPIIFMIIISLYKAGVFDSLIRLLKRMADFTKRQFMLFKNFLINLLESDWDE